MEKRDLRSSFICVGLAVFCLGSVAKAVGQEQPSAVSEAFDDWVVNCRSIADQSGKKSNCEMVQELKDRNTSQRIILVSLASDVKDVTKVTIFSPLGTKISDGITLISDGNDVVRGDISTCLPSGCLSVIPAKRDVLDRIVSGKAISIAMTSFSDGQRTKIDISTRGFVAAHNRLLVLAKGG